MVAECQPTISSQEENANNTNTKNRKIAELTFYSRYKLCQTYYKIVFFKAIVFIKAYIDSNVIYMIVIDILNEYVCAYLYSN